MKKLIIYILNIILLLSCTAKEKNIQNIASDWIGKEIILPDSLIYTIYGTDTVSLRNIDESYKIILYVDSIGCTSCKLHLSRWKEMKKQINHLINNQVEYIFFLHSNNPSEIKQLMKREKLDIPIYIDTENKFYKLNNLFPDSRFHCFLLNKENKIVLIGNPVTNNQIKNLYINYLMRENNCYLE